MLISGRTTYTQEEGGKKQLEQENAQEDDVLRHLLLCFCCFSSTIRSALISLAVGMVIPTRSAATC